MSIKMMQEVTDWGDEAVSNGVYHINEKGELVGYNEKIFKNPLKQFSKSRRKFKMVGEYDV